MQQLGAADDDDDAAGDDDDFAPGAESEVDPNLAPTPTPDLYKVEEEYDEGDAERDDERPVPSPFGVVPTFGGK